MNSLKRREDKTAPVISIKKSIEKADPVKTERQECASDRGRQPRSSQVRIAPIVMQSGRVLSREDCSSLYQGAIHLAKKIYGRASEDSPLDGKPVYICIDKCIEQLMMNNESLIELMEGNREHYLYSHAVNVSLLSIKVGITLEYDREQLRDLGVSAFLHDVGMMKYRELAMKPEKFRESEYEAIKYHPIIGARTLERSKDVSDTAILVALQEHERADGSGYPHGKKDRAINEYAKIINLVDTYEAMIHYRPYHDPVRPFDAIKKLMSMRSVLDYHILKTFIDTMGVFPFGSTVTLNTGEKGTVIKVKPGLPIRPVLKLWGKDENNMDDKTIVDLAKNPSLYITECLKHDTHGETSDMVISDEHEVTGYELESGDKERIKKQGDKKVQRQSDVSEKRKGKSKWFYILMFMSILLVLPVMVHEAHQEHRAVPQHQTYRIAEGKIPMPTFRNDAFDKLLPEAQINNNN